MPQPGRCRILSRRETPPVCFLSEACGHAGLVPVAPVLAKGDRTVAQLLAAARCGRCHAKIVVTYRIVYGGRSDIAMALTGQMPQDG